MEAPLAVYSEKQKPKEDNKFDISESFQIDDNYILKISFNEEIILYEIEDKNEFPKQDYNIILNLEEMSKLNKYFCRFESLKEVFDSFKTIISQKKLSIIKGDKLFMLKFVDPEKNYFLIFLSKKNF